MLCNALSVLRNVLGVLRNILDVSTVSFYYLGKDSLTEREGPTQLLLQQKSRMPLAGLVYLYFKMPNLQCSESQIFNGFDQST